MIFLCFLIAFISAGFLFLYATRKYANPYKHQEQEQY